MWKLGLTLLIAVIHTSTQCNIGDYVMHGLHTYNVAIRLCAMGQAGYNQLLTPLHKEEMDFLTGHAISYGVRQWIGIHSLLQPGEFVTLNGERFVENDYFRWAPGHPIIASGRECVSVDQNGLLMTESCRSGRHFFCKRITFGRNWIQFKSNLSEHEQAAINCALEGGQLMSPYTQDEFNTLSAQASVTGESYWLGINDIRSEGNFVNLDGVSVFPSDFLEWAPGRPQNDRSRNCVEIRPDGLISDEPCKKMLKYNCNK